MLLLAMLMVGSEPGGVGHGTEERIPPGSGWTIERAECEGKRLPGGGFLRLDQKGGGRLCIDGFGDFTLTARYRAPSGRYHRVDLVLREGEKFWNCLAIWRLDRGRLFLCIADASAPPIDFASLDGDRNLTLVLNRKK
jgi:hypothetical protein